MNTAFTQQLSNRSLLRYPGGKTRGVEIISSLFPGNIKEICSPFFGGGSVELFFAAKGVRIYGYDIFQPLVEFWQCVLNSRNELADVVQQYYPLTKERFYQLQEIQTSFTTKLERAAVFYVLNRASFSGSTLSGGMSPDHPRFTQTSIERLRNFYNPNLSVQQLHFKDSIALHTDTFLYLDPPYIIESTLYGKKGSTHKDFDHEELFQILKERSNWILSYNDCAEIRKIYSGYKIVTPEWKYGMGNNKSSSEVIIFSN